ncbi:sensor histidine kinase [Amycolatopsis jejuensis]|uniref:sensor histidine kinase n=1 Tax=Amycolatopsis jejuensis TaxID=330084 RepID=UPI000526C126|nr:HAMP domain-containing sensor histidine kinase [Amycolatopsis jejuensis]
MKLFPATLRWRLTTVVTLVSAAVAVTLSLLVHQQFARTQAEQARRAQDEWVQLLLRNPGVDGQVDDRELPAPLRDAVRGGNRATYLDRSGLVLWAAAETGGHVVSVRTSYAAQAQALSTLDQELMAGSAVVTAAGAVLGVVLGAGMARRLRRAAEAAREVAAGEPARVRDAIGARPRDETADLAQAVDAMADALQSRLAAEQRVTADIAHELRTPVTGLVTAAELLPPGRPAELVRDRVAALRSLVEDVLEVARLDTATERAERSEVDLAEFVQRRVPDVVIRAGARVSTDPRRLERILANLLANARRHGAPPVTVTVDGATIRVRDHGPGYPDLLLREGPARFRTGTAARGTGHGLGLTIAVAQAQVLGASLKFGNPPDGGAQATLHLPDAVREGNHEGI